MINSKKYEHLRRFLFGGEGGRGRGEEEAEMHL